MDTGTFLLMQSPSARSSEEIYTRGLELAQAAETLGRNVWLAEHHFSTYGYLSRPVQLATYIAAKTTRLRVGTAVIVIRSPSPDRCRGDRHARRAERRAPRHRARTRLSAA